MQLPQQDPLFDSLTAAQRQAVEHVDGPLLVLAGPGSGKTRVITHRIAHLLRCGVAPRQILALTFTNKAAEEMKSRLARLAPGQAVWVGTFHRFCARLLRDHAPLVGLEPNYTIYDTNDSQRALKRAMAALGVDDQHYTPQQLAGAISWAKNRLITADEYVPRPGHPLGAVVARVYPEYQGQLLAANAVDFDDLLMHTAGLLREHAEIRAELDARYRYLLVDEYQDTNLAQYVIVRALSVDHPNVAVTGDPDQSIYGWRGANLNNILDFEHDFRGVRVVRLEQNYRSTRSILRAAARLISHNRRRKEKDLYTDNAEGLPVRLVTYATQRDEAEGIAARIAEEIRAARRRPRDFAVFFRVNALSRLLEAALRDQAVAYQIVNGVEFFQRQEIKDVVAYLTLINNPRDDLALLRIINVPRRQIGRSTIERLEQHARRHGLSLLASARQAGLVPELPKRTAVSVARFVAMYDGWSVLAGRPVEEIIGHVLADTGYRDALALSESPEDQDRLANIEELLSAARQFDEQNPGPGRLEEFLEQVCLVNETDDFDAAGDRVTLMSLHASKGLEFPVVFVIALEEGLLPHDRSKHNADELEEERRLLFVGMTRAREELHLSLARSRDFRGQRGMSVPSSFLIELPREEFDVQTPQPAPRAAVEPPADDGYPASWDDVAWDTPDEADQPDCLPVEDAGQAASAEPRFAPVSLTTAAELAGAAPLAAPPLDPDVFHLAMVVRHPEYGLGKIVALSGAGRQRRATVAFAACGRHTFVIAQSPLKPARST